MYGMIVYIWNMRSGFQAVLMARADVVCVGFRIFWMSFFFFFLFLTFFFTFLFVFQVIALFLFFFSAHFFPLLSIILLLCRRGTLLFMKAFNVLCNYSWLRLPSLVTSIKHLIITRENEVKTNSGTQVQT